MKKKELLEKLNSSEELVKMAFVPVHEVIKWIEELEEETAELDNESIEEIAEEIAGLDLELIEDYELSMSYREVEIDSVTINSGKIVRIIRSYLQK